ncbi:superoxide dismutase family protein [Nonomuraea sp. NPDC048916]|uniref:superoxide dismutase family protein n=1 Tax=Nonomuraea sp. NPDC048916 TaxID=3154232 RepID=UPI0033EBBCA5
MRLPALMLVLLVAGCAQTATTQAHDAPADAAAQSPTPAASSADMYGHAPGASPDRPGETTGHTTDSTSSSTTMLSSNGTFSTSDTGAIVYDRALVPDGAQASVTVESAGGKTLTSLVVEGFLPNRRYGTHLHTKKCGPKPDDSGPHFQHEQGKANATSEVWLDFKTDESGAGRATARNPWSLDGSDPGSLVIHARPTTSTGAEAGTAGDRVACLTLT